MIPGGELRSRSVEGKSQRDRDLGGDEQQKDQILAEDTAATLFVAEVVEIGNLLSQFRAFLIRIIDDQTAVRDSIAMSQDVHTCHQE